MAFRRFATPAGARSFHCRPLGAALVALALLSTGVPLGHGQDGAPAVAPVDTTNILRQIDRANVALFERVSPSVVQIVTFVKGKTVSESQFKSGSGFFWDKDGHVVTNAHVVQDATEIAVWLASDRQFEATLVGAAPNFDLAVIRIKGLETPPAPVVLGSSDDLKVGQLAYAIGSPFGLDQSLTSGIISALKRQLPTGKGRAIANVIQTDAQVHPGSSGGPLLDSSGRVIGINTIAYSIAEIGTTFGFAIPVETAKRIVPLLIRDGRITTPGIGIIPAKPEIAVRAGIEGVIIARVTPGSPADHAGLLPTDASGKPGDVIIGVNGQPLHNVYELTDQLERAGVGGKITLKIRREGKVIEVTVGIVDLDQKS